MPVISAANLSIGYKGSPIVSNINLRLSTGRIICLLGANGAGKTTLMKTLLGRIKPVSGEVTYSICKTKTYTFIDTSNTDT